MTSAAKALSYTPSAVSQQVARLEADLGQPLLERHARGVSLTDAGRVIVDFAAQLDRHLQALEARLDDLRGVRTGSLRLGCFPTASASLLPVAVDQFRRAHPHVELSVRSARLAGLLDLLESRSVEISLLWQYDWSQVALPGLQVRPLLRDPSRLLVSAGHRLATRRSVAFEELRDERWIIRAEDHPVVDVMRRTARRAGFEPVVSFEAHDYQEAQAMVAVGLGVALAPSLALTSLRDDVRVLTLHPAAPSRAILAARLAERRPTPAEQIFWELLPQVASRFRTP